MPSGAFQILSFALTPISPAFELSGVLILDGQPPAHQQFGVLAGWAFVDDKVSSRNTPQPQVSCHIEGLLFSRDPLIR